MSNPINLPPNTSHRRLVTFAKNNRMVLALTKRINPARRIEIMSIERGLDIQPLDTLLDVGCGDGYWSNYFARKCHKLCGVDPFADDLSKAQRHARYNAEFSLATAEKLPFPDAAFSKVFGVCVFEHFFDDSAAFREMYRVLRAGGVLAGTVDSLDTDQVSETFRARHMQQSYCQQLYTIESVTEKLKAANFQKVEAHFISGSRLAVWWEMFSETSGILKYPLALLLYPVILFLERRKYRSGYKIFVRAEK